MKNRMVRDATAGQRVLTVAEYAREYGQTERAAWAQIYRGLIPYRRQGRKILILRDEVEKFLHALPGVSVEEATRKVEERTERSAA